METPIIVSIITVIGSLIAAATTFYLTKKYQLKMEWQQKKISHYKELLSALSDSKDYGMNKNEANIKFARKSNTIVLVAPQYVISALMNYHDEIKCTNQDRSIEREDELLKELILAIRRDINITEKDNIQSFKFHFIGSAPSKR